MPTPDLEKLADDFARDGIAIAEGLVDGDLLRDIDDLLTRYASEIPGRRLNTPPPYIEHFETEVFAWTANDEAAAQAVYQSQPVLDATGAVLGGKAFKAAYQVAFGSIKGCGQGWHQDTATDINVRPDQFMLNRILFTRDLDPALGPLSVVPGSFRKHLPPGENYGDFEEQWDLTPKAGTMVFLHSRCWHRVGKNQTDTPRLIINGRCDPEGADPRLADFCLFRGGGWKHSEARPFTADEIPYTPNAYDVQIIEGYQS